MEVGRAVRRAAALILGVAAATALFVALRAGREVSDASAAAPPTAGPDEAPRGLPQALPPPPASRFAELFLAAPIGERSRSDLEALVREYQVAVEGEEAAPAGRSWLEIEADLRPAFAGLDAEYLAAFEYLAASRARLDGGTAAFTQAVVALREFAASHPDVSAYDAERTVLLADLQRVLGDSGPALAALEALQQRLGPPDPATAAVHAAVWGVRADVLRETGRFDQAALATATSVHHALASGDPQAIENALLRDQELALAMRRWDACHERLNGYLATTSDPSLRALLLVMRGYAESGMAGDDADAVQRARATLDEARPLCRGHLLVRADLKRIDLALRAGDLDGAGRALRQCEELLGTALGARPSRDAGEWIAYGTVWRLRRAAPIAELVAWRPLQAAAVAALIDEWSRQPATQSGVGFLESPQRRTVLGAALALECELAAREQRADGPRRALQLLLDVQGCTSLARARGAPACTTERLLDGLGDRAALVVLRALRSTFVFFAHRGEVKSWTLPGTPKGGEACEQYARWLAVAPDVAGDPRALANRALARLGPLVTAQVLPPDLLAAILTATGLTVVGADSLGGLPFEALPLPDGRLLGEALAVDNTWSLPFAMHAGEQPVREPARVLLVADTAPAVEPDGASIERVALPEELLTPALADYGRCDRLVGAQATMAAFAAYDLRRYDVVHLIVHHVERDGAGGLVLHDGVLWRADVTQLPCDGLVVLSACRGAGATARVGEGEGFGSFVGAFLWNGARAVIASRRELLVLDHLRTMAHCHRELAAGRSPARAMQRARQAMVDGSDLVARVHRAMVQVVGAGQVPDPR